VPSQKLLDGAFLTQTALARPDRHIRRRVSKGSKAASGIRDQANVKIFRQDAVREASWAQPLDHASLPVSFCSARAPKLMIADSHRLQTDIKALSAESDPEAAVQAVRWKKKKKGLWRSRNEGVGWDQKERP
jgi:hypothetical protein